MGSTTYLLTWLTYIGLFISPGSAGFCPLKYDCQGTCYTRERYRVDCGWLGWAGCTKYRKKTRTCTKTCTRQVCCDGFTGDECNTPLCFGSTTCPNGGTCTSPNTCRCKTGYITPRCNDINECTSPISGCSHICTNTPGSFKCVCRPGYFLGNNGKSCFDIDECARATSCDQTCTNTAGSYTCSCRQGFRLAKDGKTCAVDGGFNDWSSWSACSSTCDGGNETRSRTCTNPAPQNGGRECEGKNMEVQDCNTQPCPVDGGYNSWSSWSGCSSTCDGGNQTRSRTCTNPAPQNGGRECEGIDTEVQDCNAKPCPVDGAFGDWSLWSDCSSTCNGGNQTRSRTCTNPAPQNGGRECEGINMEVQDCNTQPCPVDGGFSDWSSWSDCSVTCDGGNRTRSRTCTNPAPQNGGQECEGIDTEVQDCNRKSCSVPREFSPWSQWSDCSVTCGEGSQSRSRSCLGPAPQDGNNECVGTSKETRECSRVPCSDRLEDPEWSSWGNCSRACGSGYQTRTRDCSNPVPGQNCSPESNLETRECEADSCLECFTNQTIHLINPDPTIYTHFKAFYDSSGIRNHCTKLTDSNLVNVYFDCGSTTTTVTVYISDSYTFSSLIVSGRAHSYTFQCLPLSDYNTSISRNLDARIDQLNESSLPMYNITAGFFIRPDVEVNEARVGDTVYLIITSPVEYELLPLECRAIGDVNEYQSIITEGCTMDPGLMSSFECYIHYQVIVYNSSFLVFRFFNSDTLVIKCDVRVCVDDNCKFTCDNSSSSGMVKRALSDVPTKDEPKMTSISQRLTIIGSSLGGSGDLTGSPVVFMLLAMFMGLMV